MECSEVEYFDVGDDVGEHITGGVSPCCQFFWYVYGFCAKFFKGEDFDNARSGAMSNHVHGGSEGRVQHGVVLKRKIAYSILPEGNFEICTIEGGASCIDKSR